MPRSANDYSGQKVGHVTVLDRVGNRGRHALWRVTCDCGATAEIPSWHLARSSVSCGCKTSEGRASGRLTHGKAAKGNNRSRIYRIWAGMKSRCHNPNQPHYPRYGGRGITVCDRWQKFEDFYADMGEPPTDMHTIDRIDGSAGYQPGNCRWATYQEQSDNQAPFEHKGREALQLAGQRFGRLVAIERVGTKSGYALWRTRCDCGNEREVAANMLRRGTQSCGCLRAEKARERMTAMRRA